MLMQKKTHRKKVATLTRWWETDHDRQVKIIDTLQDQLAEYERRWLSPDGKKVLNDLNDSLHLILQYQRSLAILNAEDPQRSKTLALLERWGMEPYERPENWQEQLVRWGTEASGTETMELVAERTDDGDTLRFKPVV